MAKIPDNLPASRKFTDEELLAAPTEPPKPQLTPAQIKHREEIAHAEAIGIDPDAVSNAVIKLMAGYQLSPLAYLLSVLNDPQATKAQKTTAATAALPYVNSKPQKKVQVTGITSGVMEVPMVASMEEWQKLAAASQAQLKASVRE